MRLILLDTHAWVWWLSGSRRLKPSARAVIQREDAVGLSPISIYEVSYAHQRGRIELGMPIDRWLSEALAADITILSLTPGIAALAGLLDWAHGDPADRALVATARHHGIAFVTADKRIQSSGLVETLW